MKLNVIFAIGNRNKITGNEPVHYQVMTKEEYEQFRNRSDIIITNVWKWEDN